MNCSKMSSKSAHADRSSKLPMPLILGFIAITFSLSFVWSRKNGALSGTKYKYSSFLFHFPSLHTFPLIGLKTKRPNITCLWDSLKGLPRKSDVIQGDIHCRHEPGYYDDIDAAPYHICHLGVPRLSLDGPKWPPAMKLYINPPISPLKTLLSSHSSHLGH